MNTHTYFNTHNDYVYDWTISATVPCGHQWSVYDVLGWFCGPGLGSGSGTGFLSLKGSQGVALSRSYFSPRDLFSLFFFNRFPTF